MATNSLSSRLEELRSRNPQSPPSERAYSGYSTPTRYSGNFSNMHNHSQSVSIANDPRTSNMQRRFTTDSNTFPTSLSPIAYQNMDASADINTYHKAQALDKKRVELERVREQKKRMEEEFKRLKSMEQEQESELTRLSKDLHKMNLSPGYQSEPTTPPEYRDQAYYTPSVFGSRNRYSSASLTSPPGLNRTSRSGSQVTSPPNELANNNGDGDKLPPHSNRYSMPVTLPARQKRESFPDYPSMGLTQIDTTSILFGDEDDRHDVVTSPVVKNYLQAHTTDDKFPVLLRSNHKPGTLSASSAALDLANLQTVQSEAKSNGWPSSFHHLHRQPQNGLSQTNLEGRQGLHSSSSSQQSVETVVESTNTQRQLNHHSMEATLAALAGQSNLGQSMANGSSSSRPNLINLQSYSTNDIPTVKASGTNPNPMVSTSGPGDKDYSFQKHNFNFGRTPGNIITNRLSRDLITGEALADDPPTTAKLLNESSTEMQANATPFGGIDSSAQSTGISPYEGQNFYPYNTSPVAMGMNQMQHGGMNGDNYMNGMQYYPQQQQQQHQQQHQQYSNYNQFNAGGRYQDNQQKVNRQGRVPYVEGYRRGSRRSSNTYSDPDIAKFAGTKIESYAGEIYILCKDQHGCRYLQKQLESRHPETVQLIFTESAPHVVELMTDPFGNYLCQKLLEHSNDEQRTILVKNSAPHMVQIALNQHGTRALQKLIEHLSTDEQIRVVRNALKDNVVELIQDLNGNHVIQKCLNRLTSEESQFIFDAVGKNCVVVGTHRHGCCVLQRCVDHASGQQKADLIAQITSNAFRLVQDPYGNYVIQYILDLNDTNFTNPICYSLQSRVVELSRHKFSSNVIEKCIRHSAPAVATLMIEEMLGPTEIERMLRDSFANYVIQTALDHAQPEIRARLVDSIRPFIQSIRHTPHGRRIQIKVLQSEGSSRATSPSMSPGTGGAQIRGPGPMHRNGSGTSQQNYYNQPGQNNFGTQPGQNSYGTNGFNAPQPGFGHAQMGGPVYSPRMGSSGNYPMAPQNGMHHGMPQGYGRAPQTSGFNYF